MISNLRRAAIAQRILEQFSIEVAWRSLVGSPREERHRALVDLFVDLQHYADHAGLDGRRLARRR